jgi:hypothetical protein
MTILSLKCTLMGTGLFSSIRFGAAPVALETSDEFVSDTAPSVEVVDSNPFKL